MNLLGIYRPGKSWLHRLPASVKLSGLAVLSVLAMVWRTAESTTALLVLVSLGFIAARVGLVNALRSLRRLLVLIVAIGAFQWWQQGWEPAYTIVGNVVGLVLAATLLTTVTPVDEILDTIVRGLGPFRRFGVRPETVALAFSLLIRAIPTIMETGRETRHAALARGLGRSPRAHLAPMVIRTVAQARTTGEAIYARGIIDDDDDD